MPKEFSMMIDGRMYNFEGMQDYNRIMKQRDGNHKDKTYSDLFPSDIKLNKGRKKPSKEKKPVIDESI